MRHKRKWKWLFERLFLLYHSGREQFTAEELSSILPEHSQDLVALRHRLNALVKKGFLSKKQQRFSYGNRTACYFTFTDFEGLRRYISDLIGEEL